MTYITKADLDLVFGRENVLAWSQVDGGDEADEDRIKAALRYGEAMVEDRFRSSKYRVPFVKAGADFPAVLKDWMCKHAAMRLYEARGVHDDDDTGMGIRKQAREADVQIDLYLSGNRLLNVKVQSGSAVKPHGPVVI